MTYNDFIASLDSASFPPALDSYQQALWYEAKGVWDKAHNIVQATNDSFATRIHAYLHRVEADEMNEICWSGNMPAIFVSFVIAIKYVYS